MPISRYTSNAFWPLFFHLVDQIWCSQSLQPDFLLLRRVCEVLVAFWPDLVGQNGRRSKMANFGYTPVLALYSKTSGALCHPLKSFFLKFFGIFTFVMVNFTWIHFVSEVLWKFVRIFCKDFPVRQIKSSVRKKSLTEKFVSSVLQKPYDKTLRIFTWLHFVFLNSKLFHSCTCYCTGVRKWNLF